MELDPQPAHGRYTLRPATTGDLDFLWELKVATLKDYITELFGWDEKLARELVDRHLADADIVMVNGERAGVLKVAENDGWVYINEIGLMPRYHNSGLGSQMLRDVLAVADAAGHHVELQVMTNNPARRLYERLGFFVSHHKMYRPPGGA